MGGGYHPRSPHDLRSGREKIAVVTGVSINTVKSHALAIGRAYRKPLGDVAWGIQTGEGTDQSLRLVVGEA